MKWCKTLSPGQPLRDVRFTWQFDRREDRQVAVVANDQQREQAAYERGLAEGEQRLGEQLLRQRRELLELQNGVLASLGQAASQVVRQSESALVQLALEVASKLISGLPVSAEMVEAAVRSALAQVAGSTEFHVYVHADDLALLQQCNSPVLLPGPGPGRRPFSCFDRSHAWRLPRRNALRRHRHLPRDKIGIDPPITGPMTATLTRSTSLPIESALARVKNARPAETRGRVVQLIGLVVESEGPLASVGEVCRIESARHDSSTLAEVVGFRNHNLLLMPLGEIQGVHPGSEVIATGAPLRLAVSDDLKGRVIDGLGHPIDGQGPIHGQHTVGLHLPPPHPLKRQRIHKVFRTAVKAMDAFVPCGQGQRLGIFAGSGVGKSTLLGMMASHGEADVNVIALIGERGREVREFLEKDLDEAGRRKSVVVVATSNEPALARVKGAFLAMAIAEHFRDEGQNVLLMMDSVTRFAMAQREIGLAIGEPAATRGYTPSVFSLLPRLLERAGAGERGTITGLFTVLVEADDMNDPVADAVRSILDGHIVLSRDLATQNQYPAIEVLESVSRLTRELLTPENLDLVARAREHMAVYRKNQDLINIGAYPAGSNPTIDEAIARHDPLRQFLRQGITEGFTLEQTWSSLAATLAPLAKSKAAPAAKAA